MKTFAHNHDMTRSFTTPEDIKSQQAVVTTILLVLMMLLVANRVYVKIYLVQRCHWDDATLLIALLGTLILYSTTLWISTRSNLSTNPHGNTILSSLTNDTFTTPAFVLLTILPITYGFLKATFFILYLQLFYQLRWMRVGASVGLAVNAVTYVGFTVATLYLFVRRDIVVYGGVAIPLAAWGVVSDVVVLLMPIVAVVRLRVERRKKVGAVCIFLSGLMACVCSAVALYFRTRTGTPENVLYLLFATNIAITCELMIGTMCACMPSLAYTYRNVNALQGVRHKLSALLPPVFLRSRPVTLPTIRDDASDEDLCPVLRKSEEPSTKSVSEIELGECYRVGVGARAG